MNKHTWVSATPLDNVVGIQQNIASPVRNIQDNRYLEASDDNDCSIKKM